MFVYTTRTEALGRQWEEFSVLGPSGEFCRESTTTSLKTGNTVQRRFTVAPAKTLTLGTTEASNGSEYIFRGGQSAENL